VRRWPFFVRFLVARTTPSPTLLNGDDHHNATRTRFQQRPVRVDHHDLSDSAVSITTIRSEIAIALT
jgi:hypothetical protein